MREPNDLELIEHFLGRGSPATRRELDAALAGSPELRKRYDALAALWRLLGEADVESPDRDLWPRVSEGLVGRSPRSAERRFPASVSWWAAAAAIVVAVLVGHGSAKLRLAWQPKASSTAIGESEVVTRLGLTGFDTSSLQQLGKNLLEGQTKGVVENETQKT
jgi:ferric-dicitrate binding protein FerR (iron transport regulator)